MLFSRLGSVLLRPFSIGKARWYSGLSTNAPQSKQLSQETLNILEFRPKSYRNRPWRKPKNIKKRLFAKRKNKYFKKK